MTVKISGIQQMKVYFIQETKDFPVNIITYSMAE